MIYDALKSRLLGSICPTQDKQASFKVDWNLTDPNYIVMGSQSGKTFVINCSDMKNLQVVQEINHDTQVFGVCWNPFNTKEFSLGCEDGSVRICSMDSNIQKKLDNHTKKVFNVVYS